MSDNKNLPKEGLGDYVHGLTKGAIGAVPIVGSLASEAFSLIVSPPLKKRMDQWLENLYEEIERLKEKSEAYEPENLSNNEQFISTVTAATQMAVKTHNEEKLLALKNATINSIIQPDINFEHSLFLNLIDTLSPLHIKVLKRFYRSQGGYVVKSFYDFSKLSPSDTRIEVEPTLLPTILLDLENRGLIEKNYSSSTSSDRKLPPEHVFTVGASDIGNRFYEFITN